MKRSEALLICAVFAGLTLAPTLAWIAGVRATAFENRALAAKPAFQPDRLLDTDYYAEISDWMEDHLSLRHAAVAANATVALDIFSDSPNAQVWLSDDEWLWLDDGLRKACSGEAPSIALLGSIARVEALLRESGRELRWSIVPNKIALYPERATDRVRRAAECGETRRADLFATMQQKGTPRGFLNLHAAFAAAKQRFPHLLYFPDDSHVSNFGSALVVQQLVGSLAPQLWNPAELKRGRPGPRTGDLASMLVVRGPIQTDGWAIIRESVQPGPSSTDELAPGIIRRHFTTTGADSLLIQPPAFFLHDSQFNTAMAMSRSYFADATFLPWREFEAARVAAEMASARIIVVEVVERDFYWRVERQLGSLEFYEALRRALAAAG